MGKGSNEKQNSSPEERKLIKRRIFLLCLIIDIAGLLCIAYIFIIRPIASRGAENSLPENNIRTAVIYQNGRELMRINLNTASDNSFIIPGKKGSSNTITIKDHDIFVSDAGCPDKLCVKQGSAVSSHIPVICLPNKLIIVVENSTEGGDLDAFAY